MYFSSYFSSKVLLKIWLSSARRSKYFWGAEKVTRNWTKRKICWTCNRKSEVNSTVSAAWIQGHCYILKCAQMNTFHFPSSYMRIISLNLFEIKYEYHLQFKYLRRGRKLQAAEELSLLWLTTYQSIADNIMKVRLFVYLDFTHLPHLLASDGLGVRYYCSSGSTL